MCGIAGIVSPKGFDPASIRAMSTAISHRGPNGFGYLFQSDRHGTKLSINSEPENEFHPGPAVALAFRRLAIIDVSDKNMQPMMDPTGMVGLVYNGEIYNYRELRQELMALGWTFSTSGDTEVLLNAYLAWGPECVKRLNGMWAFAILDKRRHSLALCRDPLGIKPLYVAIVNDALYFASEIKGILAVPSLSFGPDEETVAAFLADGQTDSSHRTFFKGIDAFPAAHMAVIPLGALLPNVSKKRYFSLPNTRYHGTQEEAADKCRLLLFDSIRCHLQSDRPVGTCLSGGLDSTSIVCVSHRLGDEIQLPNYKHEAYGYLPNDEGYSEQRYMRLASDAASIRLHGVEMTDESFAKHLPDIISAQDEPFGSASVAAQWFVFRQSRQDGMTVMIDGQGADELFGGYLYYFVTLAAQRLGRFDFQGYRELRAQYEQAFGPFPASLRSLLIPLSPSWLRRLWRLIRHRQATGVDGLTPSLAALVQKRFQANLGCWASLTDKLRADVQSSSLPALLRYEDRNSMAHSIEARVPFLDRPLVEFAFSLPDLYKIQGISTKHVLRKAMRGIIPDAIVDRRDKVGFRADPGLTRRLLASRWNEWVENRSTWEDRWFDPAGVERIFAACEKTASDEFRAWRVLSVKLWARQHWPIH